MLKSLYVNNYRTFLNYKANYSQCSVVIGSNGSGKTNLVNILKIYQSIGRGCSRVEQLISSNDLSLLSTTKTFESVIEVVVSDVVFTYKIVMDLPDKFTTLRVVEETLTAGEHTVFTRKMAEVVIPESHDSNRSKPARFSLDWHMLALPIINLSDDLFNKFKEWLENIIILSPYPKHIDHHVTENEENYLQVDCSNFTNWLYNHGAKNPELYPEILSNLKLFMRDIKRYSFSSLKSYTKEFFVSFEGLKDDLSFSQLSDGEKCFFIISAVVAKNKNSQSASLIVWDEPDAYVSFFNIATFYNKISKNSCQIVLTSNNSLFYSRFDIDEIQLLVRDSHSKPTEIKVFDSSEDISGYLSEY